MLTALVGMQFSCNSGIFGKKEEDNSTRNLLIAASLLSSGTSACATAIASVSLSTGTKVTNTSATIDGTSGCVNGVTTNMNSTLPDWIKNNFKCAVGTKSGDYYIFKSQNVPNTKSFYFGSSSPLYEALPAGNTSAGTNQISSQNLVYCIPANPSKGSGTVSTQGGLVSVGITVNGLAVFNNAAAPPDKLSSEASTFDNYQGHPQNSGIYHHHAAVPYICDGGINTNNATACANSKLIGIALDGYAIYGQKCDKGTSDAADDTVPTDLDSLHGHTAVTTHFTTATYHYHYKYDSTATIYTLMGSYFYGNIGSSSN